MHQRGSLRRNLKIYIKLSENKPVLYQNFWDTAEAMLKGKLIALNIYIRKEEKY